MKRRLIAVAVVVVAVPLVAMAAAAWALDGDAIRSRLEAQVRRATGRELTIAGPVSLAWSFSPTLVLADVSLSNPPGFAAPRMAHADRIEARIGLGGLLRHRIAIERLAVVAPTIRLERDAAGRPNWDFDPPRTPVAPPAAPPSSPSTRFALSFQTVDITDATIGWGLQTVTAPHLAYDPATGAATGTVVTAGQALTLSGTVGPLGSAADPVDLHLTGSGVAAGLTGTSAAATLTVTAAELAALSPLVGRPLPSIHDVSVVTAFPGPSAIRASIGAAKLGRLTLTGATLSAASLTDPATIAATGTLGSLPLSLTGNLGSVAALLRGPAPVDARIDAPGLSLTASGQLAATGEGTLQLAAAAPDLRAVGQQANLHLPMLHGLNATAGLSLKPGSASFKGLHLTSEAGDLAGDLALSYAGRLSLRGTLASTRLDLDALASPAPAPAPSPAPAPVPATPSMAKIIPDTPLPLQSLQDLDADLNLHAASLRVGGVGLADVQIHAVLANGTLQLDPANAAFGAATARATLRVDAAAVPPTVHATIDAPGLPFGAVMALAGQPTGESGTLDLRADLAGTGATLRALAATLAGQAGLALVDAQVENAMLERLVAAPLRAAGVSLGDTGTTDVRCAAIRADAAGGRVRFSALTLDTSKLALDGSGDVDLGAETMDLHLRPELRLGGGLSVPIRLRGTLAAPRAQLDPGAIASGRVGIVLGGAPPPDRCGPALAAARDGKPGPAAAPPPPSRAPKPADFLRGLLR